MNMKELIRKTRTYRRFSQEPVSEETLRELVDLARLSANHKNIQPLKFMLSNDKETNSKIFPCTGWAAGLKHWNGPEQEERPTAYIIILLDTEIDKEAGQDPGIAAQSIVLGAMEKGIGACMIGTLNKKKLTEVLKIPQKYEIHLVIALGKPGEKVVIEEIEKDGNTVYYRDENDVHHVPKRKLDDIIIPLN